MEEIIQEVIQENFPELKGTSFQIKRILQVPGVTKENNPILRLIIVKGRNSEDKSKVLKASREEKNKDFIQWIKNQNTIRFLQFNMNDCKRMKQYPQNFWRKTISNQDFYIHYIQTNIN